MEGDRQTGDLDQQIDEEIATRDVGEFVAQCGSHLFAAGSNDEIGWNKQRGVMKAQRDGTGNAVGREQADILDSEGLFPALPLGGDFAVQLGGHCLAKQFARAAPLPCEGAGEAEHEGEIESSDGSRYESV